MKKITVFIAFLFVGHLSYAQGSKITIGVASSYDAYSVKYKENPNPSLSVREYQFLTGFSVGGRFEYDISEKLTFRSGIFYANKGYTVDYCFSFSQPNDPLIPKTSTIKAGFISIPLMLGYEMLTTDKFKIIPAFGVVISGKIHESEVTVYQDDSERKSDLSGLYTPVLSNSQFSVQANLVFSYSLTDNIFVLLEPYFNYGFSGLNTSIESSNPKMYGGILSVNFKL